MTDLSRTIQHYVGEATRIALEAKAAGVILTIENRPQQPLAMGNTKPHVEARAAVARPAPPPLPREHQISDREWSARDPSLREGSTVRVPGVGEL